MWRLPLLTVLFLVLTAVPLGIARGALDEIATLREGRVARRGQLSDDPVASPSSPTPTVLRGRCGRLREGSRWPTPGEPGMRSTGRASPHPPRRLHACDMAVAATSIAHALGGGEPFDDSPMLRALLDVDTARQHLLFAHKHRVDLGKALTGLDVVYPPFLT